MEKLGYIAGVWVVKTRLWGGLWNIRWGESESRRHCGSIRRVQKLIWSHGRSVFDVLADGFFYNFLGRQDFFKISGFWDGFFTKRVAVRANRGLIDENGHSWLREVRFWRPFWLKVPFLTKSGSKKIGFFGRFFDQFLVFFFGVSPNKRETPKC